MTKEELERSYPHGLQDLTSDELRRKALCGSVMSQTLQYLTSQLVGYGFTWMLPVIISKSTDPLWPDPGASIEKRIQTEIYGDTVNLTSSMIIHKMISCSLLHPKLFILSPNIRIEKRERGSTGWHAYEFTQLDFEVRHADFPGIKNLVEDLLLGLVRRLEINAQKELEELEAYGKIQEIHFPFDVFDRITLVQKYGSTWESELPSRIDNPVWVRNIPREFYDYEDMQTGEWDNYDLYVPRYGEVLSGARREHEYSKILTKIERDGVRKENYKLLLDLARSGRILQSAGAGIGIERLVTWLTSSRSIYDVQPFPKVPGIVHDL